MRNLSELAYLYPGHALLREVQDRDIEIAKRDRQLAGATKRADGYAAKLASIRRAVDEMRRANRGEVVA